MRASERRARELLLNMTDTRNYCALLDQGERAEFRLRCPGCRAWLDGYESTTLHHARTCEALRALPQCHNCGQLRADAVDRPHGIRECDPCWRASLRHGHEHADTFEDGKA